MNLQIKKTFKNYVNYAKMTIKLTKNKILIFFVKDRFFFFELINEINYKN